jgi:hypothetical protein
MEGARVYVGVHNAETDYKKPDFRDLAVILTARAGRSGGYKEFDMYFFLFFTPPPPQFITPPFFSLFSFFRPGNRAVSGSPGCFSPALITGFIPNKPPMARIHADFSPRASLHLGTSALCRHPSAVKRDAGHSPSSLRPADRNPIF